MRFDDPLLLPLLLFTTFIAENPDFAAWLIGGLFSIIGAGVAAGWYLFKEQIKELKKTDEEILRRMKDLELAQKGYEKLDNLLSLPGQVHALQLDNQKAHDRIESTLDHRMTRIEVIADRLEKSLPNGELREVVQLMRTLIKQQER